MTVEQRIVEKLRTLTPKGQQKVLELVEEIGNAESSQPQESPQPRRSLRGLWKDLKVDVSEKDIAEARREMWGNFPRPFPE